MPGQSKIVTDSDSLARERPHCGRPTAEYRLPTRSLHSLVASPCRTIRKATSTHQRPPRSRRHRTSPWYSRGLQSYSLHMHRCCQTRMKLSFKRQIPPPLFSHFTAAQYAQSSRCEIPNEIHLSRYPNSPVRLPLGTSTGGLRRFRTGALLKDRRSQSMKRESTGTRQRFHGTSDTPPPMCRDAQSTITEVERTLLDAIAFPRCVVVGLRRLLHTMDMCVGRIWR